MSFRDKIKQSLKNSFKSNVVFEVIGGQNYLPDTMANVYSMRDESKEYGKGVVEIEKELYYFLGAITQEQYKEGKKRTISGTIVGGALAGPVGAVIGSQTRRKRKNISTYLIELADYRSEERFTIQVKGTLKNSMLDLPKFKPVNPKEIGIRE